jgi:hypothetical protein
VGQHRGDGARHVGGVRPPVRLLLQGIARPDVSGDVGDVDPEPHPPLGSLGGDGVIEVVRAGGVDREGGEIPQVLPICVEQLGTLGRLCCLLLDPPGEPRADLTVLQQRRDHVGRPRRVPELADDPGPPPALAEVDQGHFPRRRGAATSAQLDPAAPLEEEISGEEPAALLDEDYALQSCGANVWSAFCSPSSGLVLGLSFAFTCGGMPTSLIDVPLRVRYCPTVRSSAAPFFRGITS